MKMRPKVEQGATTMNPITVFLALLCGLAGFALGGTGHVFLAAPFLVAAFVVAFSLKMANAWQKFVILRAGSCKA